MFAKGCRLSKQHCTTCVLFSVEERLNAAILRLMKFSSDHVRPRYILMAFSRSLHRDIRMSIKSEIVSVGERTTGGGVH